MIDPFFADDAFNRGGHIGIFTDIDNARYWLQRSPIDDAQQQSLRTADPGESEAGEDER